MEFHHLKIFFVVLAVFCLAFFGFGLYYLVSYLQAHSAPTTVSIENKVSVVVAVADTDTLRRRGLSGRPILGELEGMLFIFDNPALSSFWMKEMLIPIDIIWIRQGVIVGYTENIEPPASATPDNFLLRYPSPIAVDAVLEVTAGFALRHNLEVGDKIAVHRLR